MKDKAALGYLRALMTANDVKPQYRGHVESILRQGVHAGREEAVLKILRTRTCKSWFTETENANGTTF
jgi:hypothetical protein